VKVASVPPTRRSVSRATPRAVAVAQSLAERRDRLDDEARFLLSWFVSPVLTGAVMPSGKVLAATMASYVDPAIPGPVIELGPGTGPVTEALLARGLPPERLILVEYCQDFCALLRKRFPGAKVVRGDAYAIDTVLGSLLKEPASAVLSSLPLLTKPPEQRAALLRTAHDLMHPGAPFVQFTYGVKPPIPPEATGSVVGRSSQVWRNLPPARVWTYRRPGLARLDD
jgi:phosphatidylethanolamine/phosphatidyl-N-methylethanolamine N-methyltransferase